MPEGWAGGKCKCHSRSRRWQLLFEDIAPGQWEQFDNDRSSSQRQLSDISHVLPTVTHVRVVKNLDHVSNKQKKDFVPSTLHHVSDSTQAANHSALETSV